MRTVDIYHLINYAPVIGTNLGISSNDLEKYIKEAYCLGDSQNQKTNVKAIMSSYSIWEETQVFNPLLDLIGDFIFNHLNPQFYASNFIENSKMVLNSAWSAIYKKGHYTIPHKHGTTMDWSFVFYLQSTGKTPLVFDYNNKQFFPTANTLIVFPSYLTHSVPEHKEEEDRVCLAGNFKIKNK